MVNVNKLSPEEKVKYMQTEKVSKLVGRLAIPTIISMLVTACYNMADTFFVGRISTQATAAVGLVFVVMGIIQAFGFFFGQGSGIYISAKLGAGEFDEAKTMAACGFFYAFVTGIVIGALGLIFLDPLAILLGSTQTILPYTRAYMRIILMGAPFMMCSFVTNNQLRFQGSASYAMIGICTGAVLNVGLDPLFIFGCNMGVEGAALATVVGQLVSFTILLVMTYRGNNLAIRLKNFRFDVKYLKEIGKGGVPSLIRQGLGSISATVLNRAAGTYGGEVGDAAIAAMSIANRVFLCCNSALIGFGQGFQPVCGMNYGGKKYKRVKDAFIFCLKISTVVLIAIAVLCFIFSEQIVMLFRKEDADVIRIGAEALRFRMAVFPINSLIVLCNMMFQSTGKAFRASLIAACRQGLFTIPLVLILPNFIGLLGVEMSPMLSDICSFAVSLPMTIAFLRQMGKNE